MDLDEAQKRLLDAAEQLFNERGIQGVGMDAIRAASGVSLKRLYQVFPAKEQLVEAVLRRRSESVGSALRSYVERYGTPRERILGVFDYLNDWFQEPDFRGCTFINSFGELGGTSAGVTDVAREHKHALKQLFTSLVAEAGLPESLGPQLALLANGAMAIAGIDGTPDAAREAQAAARSLLLRPDDHTEDEHQRRQLGRGRPQS